MLLKTVECLSMSLVVHKERDFSLFHLVIGVASGTFQPFAACYGLFRVVPLVTTDEVTDCFDLEIYYKSTSCIFYYKVGQALLKSGTALMYCKVGEVLFQSGVAILHYQSGQVVLQSRAGITKWVYFYNKVVHVLQIGAIIKSRTVQMTNERNGEGQ